MENIICQVYWLWSVCWEAIFSASFKLHLKKSALYKQTQFVKASGVRLWAVCNSLGPVPSQRCCVALCALNAPFVFRSWHAVSNHYACSALVFSYWWLRNRNFSMFQRSFFFFETVNCKPTYFLNIAKTTSNIQQNTHYVSIFLLVPEGLYFFKFIFRILRNVSGLPLHKPKVGFHVTQRCCFSLVCQWQHPQKLPMPICSRNNQFHLSSEGNVSIRTTSRCLLTAAHDSCCSAAARLPSAGFLQLFTFTRISILPEYHSQPKHCKMSPPQ